MKFPMRWSNTCLPAGVQKSVCGLGKSLEGGARIIVALSLALGLFTLSACSLLKIAYNQAPGVALRYIDTHLDLTQAQSLQVKSELLQLQAWHRRTQLPRYRATLQKWQTQVRADVSPQEVCTVVQEVREQLTTLANQAEPAVVALTLTLQEQQLQHLEKQWAEKNNEYRKEFLQGSADDKQKRRLKKAVERAEWLYGKLEPAQVSLLKEQIHASAFDPSLSLQERAWHQQDALQTLRKLSAPASVTENPRTMMRALFARALNPTQGNPRQYLAQLTQEGCRHAAQLHNSTSARQREQAAQTLQGYAEDLRVLMAQAS